MAKRALRCELTYYGKQYPDQILSGFSEDNDVSYGRVTYIWYMMDGDYIDLEVYNASMSAFYPSSGGAVIDAGMDYIGRKEQYMNGVQIVPPSCLCWRIGCEQDGHSASGQPRLVISKPYGERNPDTHIYGNITYMPPYHDNKADTQNWYISQVVPETVEERIAYLKKRNQSQNGIGDEYGWSDNSLKNNMQDIPTYNYIHYATPDPHIRKRPAMCTCTGNGGFPTGGNNTSYDIEPGESFTEYPTSQFLMNYPSRFRFTGASIDSTNGTFRRSASCEFIMDLIRHANDHNVAINGHMHPYIGGIGPNISDGARVGSSRACNLTYGSSNQTLGGCWVHTVNGSPEYHISSNGWYNRVLSIEQSCGLSECQSHYGNDLPGWLRPTKNGAANVSNFVAFITQNTYPKNFLDYTFYDVTRWTYANIDANPNCTYYGLDTCLFRIFNSDVSNAKDWIHANINKLLLNPNQMPYVGIFPISAANMHISQADINMRPNMATPNIIGDCIKKRFTGFYGVGQEMEKALWPNDCGPRNGNPYIGSTLYGVYTTGSHKAYMDPNYWFDASCDVYGTIGIRVQSVYNGDNQQWNFAPGSPDGQGGINCFIVPSFYSNWPALDIYGYEPKTTPRRNGMKWKTKYSEPTSTFPSGAIESITIFDTDSAT
jgi:hypothetical protein